MSDYLGFDEALLEKDNTPVVDNAVEFKPKRAPYTLWCVGGEEYRLRLTSSAITKLEQKYKRNLLLYLMSEGIPTLSAMLETIQAAMMQNHHGMTFLKVLNLYDQYVDEGGDQSKLLVEVITPLLEVSGFFTPGQAEILSKEMQNLDTNL